LPGLLYLHRSERSGTNAAADKITLPNISKDLH
jgi:hypothetical protein